ncbi:MAG: carboxypeptidase-like regulatory domain-containing protein [Paludibacteraceae bacterium]|nr:carboxypeptidase-like regulatory domain-containing protein [Paludibacteraceae bacterium]
MLNFKYYIAIITTLIAQLSMAWTIGGRVTDKDNLPISDASAALIGTTVGTLTDEDGRFSLDVKSDTAILSISMLGYTEERFKITKMSGYLRIRLQEDDIVLSDVTVEAQRKQSDNVVLIDVSNMRNVTTVTGGVEGLVKSQAGVVSTNELSQQYSVRGGSYDENSVYVNGIEIFRPQLVRSAQQEGLSFVNLDMVESVEFSSGGFAAEVGDKMSSVLDIRYRKPERKFEGSVSGSFLGASASIGSQTGKFSQLHGFRYKSSEILLNKENADSSVCNYDTDFIDYQTYLSWEISPKWEISLLGNIARNKYNFTPKTRETNFGSVSDTKKFKVFYDGGEVDDYRSYFGNLSLDFKPRKNIKLSLLGNEYRSEENVTYDIDAEYFLSDIVPNDVMNVDYSQGVAAYLEHARNNLKTNIVSLSHIGEVKLTKNILKWGLTLQKEKVEDRIAEWEMRDSSGYSQPSRNDCFPVFSNQYSDLKMESSRFISFLQNTLQGETDKGRVIFTAGVRFNYWSFNDELLFSPRASVAYFPEKCSNWGFRWAIGRYFQSPFYKELRDTFKNADGDVEVRLNDKIQSPRSWQLVVGADKYFSMWRRPFKFTYEIYGKYIDRLIPYTVDNVEILYEGENNGIGYVVGADVKLFGEFVPGSDSWISVGWLRARENIYGDGKGYMYSPNSRTYNVSLFFQDKFPNIDQLEVNLTLNFAGGFRYGKPGDIERDLYTSGSYTRADIGATYSLKQGRDKVMTKPVFRKLRGIGLSLDCLNLFAINNVSSYSWIKTADGHQCPVPNYLTGRQLNLKLRVDF